jgi:single-stranded-DNA-specific exonuclease
MRQPAESIMTLPASALPIEPPPAFLGVARSLTGKVWRDRLDVRGAARALAIVQRYQLPEMLARVLAGRDVEIDAVMDFLDPTIRKLLPDPYTVTAMEAAAKRIADAAVRGEKVSYNGEDIDFEPQRLAGPITRSSATTMSTARPRRRCSHGICAIAGWIR